MAAAFSSISPFPPTNFFFYQHRLRRRRSPTPPADHLGNGQWPVHPDLRLRRPMARLYPLIRATGNGPTSDSHPTSSGLPPDIQRSTAGMSSADGYVGLFVRMLGLDNDPLDREQAITTLWKYSQGGKKCIDIIMQFPGCINLVVSLLKSESPATCEAAAGFLQTVSAVSIYRDVIADTGAIEEMSSLLCQPSLTSEVKEQILRTLWNLSTDEKLRTRIAKGYMLPMLVSFLDGEEVKVKEAAGGILANLSLTLSLHSPMVEAGVIPKLAYLFKINNEDHKIIRKEAKATLLELAKDDYYRILIIEEGLVRVPLVGADAYRVFRPPTHSWPSLPDGTEIERNSTPSRYGASELLLGLSVREKNFNLEEAKINAIVGRSQQQFLARIGAIEVDGVRKSQLEPQNQQYTLLPWIDGIARLVLILGLEDVSAIIEAAHAVADASISEHMRISFKEAGAIKLLVPLLQHNSEVVQEAAAHALDRLSFSHIVLQTIEEEGVLEPLTSILKEGNTSATFLEKAVNILSRIFEPGNIIDTKFSEKVTDGSKDISSEEAIGGFSKVPYPISRPKLLKRGMVMDSSFISRLTEILRTSSPSLQVKVASVLVYLVTLEANAAAATSAGIELALDAVFRKGSTSGM
ncbi:hypothetical protein Cni_G23447 [Canna indica]|uniref:ARM repeat superfamily protein n=1 Tax=Canna indica TaxID=4628 RepID=A0AAQ3KYL0_9LILI|nr:hypothetical protein Cni_G23447 [Canna indica]